MADHLGHIQLEGFKSFLTTEAQGYCGSC
ncbi:uncharacterized protein G2W53_039672 [Senna tora]|uniref:Uncharacterized protein n=1 Tax=Senna tora TaxID=362788 RepID=A0A834SPX4_9FABA|nr:uncharacterized protein G2W53_039672 [Senna tora]